MPHKDYFDSSVYGFIDACKEADEVAAWLKKTGHVVVASVEANIGEALRIPDPAARHTRIAVITKVARQRSGRPIDVVAAEEFLTAIEHHRPGWLRRKPRNQAKEKYLKLQRRQWNALVKDPGYMPPYASTVLTILHTEFGLNRQRQRERRDQLRSGADIPPITADPALQAAIASLNWSERHIRYQLSGEWYFQFKEPKTTTAVSDWLLPSFNLNRMFAQPGDDWFRFWMQDVKLLDVPTNYIGALVEHLQLQRKIEIGNTVDQIHAGYLLQSQHFVTADDAFYDVINEATKVLAVPAKPLFIRQSAGGSALAELQRVL